jgi:hydrogenase maturation protease
MTGCRDNAGEILVFGCGRWLCRDDQVGLLVAQALETRALETRQLAGVRIITSENPGADLPACLSGERLLVVIDAAAADDRHPPGTWQRIDARRIRAPTVREVSAFIQGAAGLVRGALPYGRGSDQSRDPGAGVLPASGPRANTHAIGVDVALDLAADLDVLPETVWIYAIAIGRAERGDEVTPAVQRAASEVTDAIAADIHRWRTQREQQHA